MNRIANVFCVAVGIVACGNESVRERDATIDVPVADARLDATQDATDSRGDDAGLLVPIPSAVPSCDRPDFTRPRREYVQGRGNGLAYLLIRCTDADLIGPSKDYQPLYLEVRTSQASYAITRAQIVSYEATHHNWSDTLIGVNDRHFVRWHNITEVDPDMGARSTVRVETRGDASLGDAGSDASLGSGTVVVPETVTNDVNIEGPE